MSLSVAVQKLKRLLDNLPLPDERIPEAERLIRECSEAELLQLGLGPPPRPVVPRGLIDGGKGGDAAKQGGGGGAGGASPGSSGGGGPQQRLHVVQHVINSLQYNHTPGYYYNVSKSRPYSRIMDTAREALRVALPIKCLEAVFLGALLTAGWHELDRLPLAFKSTVQGQTYRHIVLVVYHGPSRKWGALGLSRRPELMDKELVYDSLADLVSDYKSSYERWWHTLVRVYVGLPLEHDTYYSGPVCWRYLTLSLSGRKAWASHRAALDRFAGQARRLAAKFRSLGGKPTSEGSLGGPADLLQLPGQAGGDAQKTAATAAAGAVWPVGASAASAPALYTARCAKSVSPTRRRPPPPPPVRRPGTPSRSLAAAPGSPSKAAAAAAAAAPGAAAAAAAKAPVKAAATGSTANGRSPGGGADACMPCELAADSHEVGKPDGDAAAAEGSSTAALSGGGDRGGARSSGGGGGAVGAVTAVSDRPPECCASAAAREDGGAAAGAPGSNSGSGSGGGGHCRTGERSLGEAGAMRGGRRSRGQPRRSSDPGSAAALAAMAAASRRRSSRAHARLLRQQVRGEEQRSCGGGVAGDRAVKEATAAYEEDDEEEESESEEGEYLSDEDD